MMLRFPLRECIVFLALVGLCPQTGRAAGTPGSLDADFGCPTAGACPGYATLATPFGFFAAVTLQPDGRIVTAGATTFQPLLARWSENGIQEADFGSGGVTTPAIQGLFTAVTVLDDGKLLAAGSTSAGGSSPDQLTAYRFDSAGMVDPTFGNMPASPGAAVGPDGLGGGMAVQPDGRIIVVGWDVAAVTFKVVRFTADGTVDESFGCTSPPCSGSVSKPAGFGHSVALQMDGKIVVAGVSDATTSGQFRVARYHANGILDDTFGCAAPPCTGFVTGPDGPPLQNSTFTSVAIDGDGNIVIAGNDGSDALSPHLLVARYTSNGVLDDTFGCETAPCSGFNVGATGLPLGQGLAVQSDGKLVVAGATTVGPGGSFVVQRFESDGAVDRTFGCGSPPCPGFVTGPQQGGFAVALQTDGKIVVSGSIPTERGDELGRVARYENDIPTGQLLLTKAAVRRRSDSAKITCRGRVPLGPIDPLAGLTLRFTDALNMIETVDFTASDCSPRREGKTRCRTPDRNAKIRFIPRKKEHELKFVCKIKGLSFDVTEPQKGPITARIGQADVLLEGSNANCKLRRSKLICKN